MEAQQIQATVWAACGVEGWLTLLEEALYYFLTGKIEMSGYLGDDS
jgi:hypothetical protein